MTPGERAEFTLFDEAHSNVSALVLPTEKVSGQHPSRHGDLRARRPKNIPISRLPLTCNLLVAYYVVRGQVREVYERSIG
jgi:hypothetical protein